VTDALKAPDGSDTWAEGDRRGDGGRDRLGTVLVAAGVITTQQLDEALTVQRTVIGPRRRLGHVLVDLDLATERQIAEALAAQLRLDLVDLTKAVVAPDCARLLPRGVAQRVGIQVLSREGSRITVAAVDPTDVVALDDVRLHTGATDIAVTVVTESQLRDHLARVWSLSEDAGDVTTFFDDAEPAPPDHSEETAAVDDAPTVRVVTTLLVDAVRGGASDIHVEPQRGELRIRYRVDGVMRDVMTLPNSATPAITSRIKIVSGLDIAERRLPQDGRTRFAVDGRAVDARVSTMPAIHGEKVVVRLLTRSDQVPALDAVGLFPEQLAAIRAAVTAAQGLVIITGPTGSGKTSTLYSLLPEVDTTERNVVTLEDPVEVQFPGITQVQVHERVGLTFSRGLRALLRQDPDVVLVGEVRDGETAELTVRASLTGHLVLTTMHTNSTVAAMTRFVEMGVEPFMVGSSLSVVVAQRLVRRPCAGCAIDDRPDPALLRSLGVSEADLTGATPRRGAGCVECGDTGYRGRLGVFEVLPVDRALRRVLAIEPSERAISDAAGELVTLRAAAVRRALRGETTFDEVARVSPRP
jgi:type IV pilus assembly protein PilB